MSRTHLVKRRSRSTRDVGLQVRFALFLTRNDYPFPKFTHSLIAPTSACGKTATGYTAAMSQLSFGSAPGSGPGDACGRCFALTGAADPYSPSYTGPFKTVVVKVTDLCPVAGNAVWCGMTTADPVNQYDMPVQ